MGARVEQPLHEFLLRPVRLAAQVEVRVVPAGAGPVRGHEVQRDTGPDGVDYIFSTRGVREPAKGSGPPAREPAGIARGELDHEPRRRCNIAHGRAG
ncbi:hypothetical protein GCM10027563_40480 [Parasphingorhabdus pacifica]